MVPKKYDYLNGFLLWHSSLSTRGKWISKNILLGGVSDFPQLGEGLMIRTLERILPDGYE